MNEDIIAVASDDRVTRRERRRQSDYRTEVLGLPPGERSPDRVLGNYLRFEDRRHNFLSGEAFAYAEQRAQEVQREGGTLEATRLFTNMLSSMPLAFSIFGHLRAHPAAAVAVLNELLGLDLVGLEDADVRGRRIGGIECEWAPHREEHLADRTAFDAVIAARRADGRTQLIAVETKYVDTFSRDPQNAEADAKYDRTCREFGMAPDAFDQLRGPATRQLLRNVLLTESVRRGGRAGGPVFDGALTLVLARDDDDSARAAVTAVAGQRGALPTDVVFAGHGDLADAAHRVTALHSWAADFRRRYVG